MHCTKTSMCLSQHVYLTIKKKKWSGVYLPILLKSATQLHWPLSYSYRQGSRGHHGGQKTWQFQTLQFRGKSTLENIMQNIDSAERPLLSTAHTTKGALSQRQSVP